MIQTMLMVVGNIRSNTEQWVIFIETEHTASDRMKTFLSFLSFFVPLAFPLLSCFSFFFHDPG
jgi:hypothetical protein